MDIMMHSERAERRQEREFIYRSTCTYYITRESVADFFFISCTCSQAKTTVITKSSIKIKYKRIIIFYKRSTSERRKFVVTDNIRERDYYYYRYATAMHSGISSEYPTGIYHE